MDPLDKPMYASIPTKVNKHICNYPGCEKSFRNLIGLENHNRIHTGEKPFKCEYPGCEKTFTQKGHHKEHQRIHTGEFPFQCTYMDCGKKFNQQGQLISHMSTHIPGYIQDRPYVCNHPDCEKKFPNNKSLKRHEIIHTSNKPFACDYPGCDHVSNRPDNLIEHKRNKHNNEMARQTIIEGINDGSNNKTMKAISKKRSRVASSNVTEADYAALADDLARSIEDKKKDNEPDYTALFDDLVSLSPKKLDEFLNNKGGKKQSRKKGCKSKPKRKCKTKRKHRR